MCTFLDGAILANQLGNSLHARLQHLQVGRFAQLSQQCGQLPLELLLVVLVPIRAQVECLGHIFVHLVQRGLKIDGSKVSDWKRSPKCWYEAFQN